MFKKKREKLNEFVRNSKFSFRRIATFLRPVFLVAVFFLLNKALQICLFWDNSPNFILFGLLSLCLLLFSIYYLIKLRVERLVSCLLAIVVCYFLAFGPSAKFADYYEIKITGSAKILTLFWFYHSCAAAGADAGNGNKIALCGRRIYYDDAFRYGDAGYGVEFVYDSSDQIMLPTAQRSAEWKAAAEKVGGLRGYSYDSDSADHKAHIVTYDIFGSVIPLWGHFYEVTL